MFDSLDAPIVRLGAKDCPIPYSPALEPLTVPNKDDIKAAVKKTLE
jgi:pyruvate dehydrogenase E1 component beta subunit